MNIHACRSWHKGLGAGLAAVTATLLVSMPAHAAGGGSKTGTLPTISTTDYDYYLTGNGSDVTVAAPNSQMLVLMGGGEDVKNAFERMIERAREKVSDGKVDVVVIRTSGADGYNPYLSPLPGVDSVETLVIKTRAGANDASLVNKVVAGADVLFIAGGDQSTYINLWQGTQLDKTLQFLLGANGSNKKVPFGGTSAGLAVLGDIDYSGENGSVTSKTALSNPYDSRVTLSRTFITGLPGLSGVITDSHLQSRDRMGRLVTFLARMIKDGMSPVGTARGIGVDEMTAAIIDGGSAYVVGSGSAYFVKPTIAATVIAPRQALEMKNVAVYKLKANMGSLDLGSWATSGTTFSGTYYLDASKGSLTSTQNGGGVY